jgi:NAD(P)-dependent dehydrogenase (short-subunit alcohol dehydrogenase family)
MFDVGLRSSYVASHYAAPLLIRYPEAGGLVVSTSSFGGGCYMHGPAYGAVKAGVDKMAHDMAVDLAPFNVAAVSIWMGLLRTERTAIALASGRYGPLAATAESPEFTGRVIAALARHPDRMRWSGQVLIGAELGAELGVVDVGGTAPPSHRPQLGDPVTYNGAVVG